MRWISLLIVVGTLLGQEAAVSIGGDVRKPMAVSVSELKTMPQAKSADRKYGGVWLDEVLVRAGVEFGKSTVHSYLVATGRDGYKAVYSMSEVDPAMTQERVLLAIVEDGKQLRLVAPRDKRAARWVKDLEKIEVVLLLR